MTAIKSRLYIFDFIRAVAVLSVILGHYLIHHSPHGVNTALGRLAPIGVGMFFFISGYLIFMTMTKSTTKSFLWHRYFRIVPTLVAGIALLAIFNSVFSIKSFLSALWMFESKVLHFGKFALYRYLSLSIMFPKDTFII
jgi:peptidoglycan/LPS O-acetylase OafA/YrhL